LPYTKSNALFDGLQDEPKRRVATRYIAQATQKAHFQETRPTKTLGAGGAADHSGQFNELALKRFVTNTVPKWCNISSHELSEIIVWVPRSVSGPAS
jgi:hypothetical protein